MEAVRSSEARGGGACSVMAMLLVALLSLSDTGPERIRRYNGTPSARVGTFVPANSDGLALPIGQLFLSLKPPATHTAAVVASAPINPRAAGVGIQRAAGEAPGLVHPRIFFSPDERTVTIQYEKGAWQFVRPVASPWNYPVAGRTYWIAPDGDDAGDGSPSRPFSTLGRGITAAEPGDVVYARSGTYIENLHLTKSGEEGKPIVLSCAPGELGQVRITPSAAWVQQHPSGAVIELAGCRHVWINGLVIEGPRGRLEAPRHEMYGANGITWAGGAGFECRATNSVIYGNVHCGLKEMGHGGTGILMEGNIIFENGTAGTDHGIYCPADALTIRGNIIFNNAGYGIHSYMHPKGQLIIQNICVGNRAGGIILSGSANRVFHNVCVGNGIGIFYFRGGCTDNIVEYNVFAFNRIDCGYDNGSGGLGDPAQNIDNHNSYFPGKPDAQVHPGAYELLADPHFVDAAHGDFRLKPDSPCLGRAIDAAFPRTGRIPNLGAF